VTERRAAARALLLACATLGPAALAALAALAAPVAAQEQTFTVPADPSAPREQAITIVSDATAGARRPGGFGWVRVEAFNPDVASHEVELGVGDRSSLGGAHARRVVRLGPGERAALSLPVPYANWLNELVVRVDGGEPASSNIVAAVPGSTSTLPSILALTDDASFGALLRARAEIEMPVLVDSGTLTGFVVKRVRDLPDAWQMLSAFDVIVLDARSDFLRPESQQVLADWVAAGGRLVVAGEAPSGDAPLAAMLDDAPRTPGTHGRAGLGQWMLAPRDEQCLGQDVMQWLRAPELPGLGRSFSGLPHDGLASHLVIPGVGKVPRRQFLLLILAFIVAIGVITLMQVRRKRHGRLLVVVPGTGMAFTFALLAYGYLSEGLGIKGVVRSVTLLDQRRHEAVDVAQRTVYAGLQPDDLQLAPGTLLVSWDQFQGSDEQRQHRLELELTNGWVVGSQALPARLPTSLATVSVCRPRERLRLRREGPQRLTIVPDAELRPSDEPGSLLVRDFQGEWWASTDDHTLRRPDPDELPLMLDRLLGEYQRLEAVTEAGWSENGAVFVGRARAVNIQSPALDSQMQLGLHGWVAGFANAELPPGSYLASVEDDPCVDDLGLTVRWVSSAHLVVGRLAREDLLE